VISAEGDTIDYTFTVVNTGNVTIGDIVVADTKCATSTILDSETDAQDTILQVGDTQIWSCTSIAVTQAEIDAGVVLNDVTVSGTPAGGLLEPVTDNHDLLVDPTPAWELVKTTSSTPAIEGDTLDYSFTLVNTGNVTISGVVITDVKCAAPPALTTESGLANVDLDPGETQVWTCTSIGVTQAEVDAGAVLNDATATGTPAGGTLDPVLADHLAPITPAPSWAIVKATSSAPTEAGETLDYTFTLTNTGNVSITNVAVTDTKCDGGPVLDSESLNADTILEFNETQVWSCTSIAVTQAEVDAGAVPNAVTADGSPAGGTLEAAADELTIPIVPAPAFSVVKSAGSAPTTVGDTIDYSFTVVNTGNVSIANVVVTDNKCASVPAIDTESGLADGILDAGETQVWSCTSIAVTQAEIDAGEVLNSVEVSGSPAGGVLAPVADDHVVAVAQAPAFDVLKASSSTPVAPGDTLDYTFTIVMVVHLGANVSSGV